MPSVIAKCRQSGAAAYILEGCLRWCMQLLLSAFGLRHSDLVVIGEDMGVLRES